MKLILILLFVNVFTSFSAITEEVQQNFIDELNDLRSETDPNAANMRKVEWSDCLSEIARDFAEMCDDSLSHNPDRTLEAVESGCVPEGTTIGESVIFSSAELTVPIVIQILSEGKSSYNYADHTCSDICGGYLQLINAETYAVGCYYRSDEAECERDGYTVICNYANAPVLTERPYIEGEACSQCPDDHPSCDSDGLCVQAEPTQPTQSSEPTSSVTNPSPGGPKHHNHNHDHDHKHNHNHNHKDNHKHGHHGHKDEDNNPNIDAQNGNDGGHNHGSHDHQNGHKKHDHNHGGPHDHAHKHDNDNDNGNSKMYRHEALAASDATCTKIMGLLLVLSTLLILISSL